MAVSHHLPRRNFFHWPSMYTHDNVTYDFFLTLSKTCRYLAPLHGIHYVTPSLVALAARKVYSHRIVMATPQRERSTQYGTSLVSAQEILEGLDPQKVIDNVLGSVRCPA